MLGEWQKNCSERLSHTVEGDLNQRTLTDIKFDNSLKTVTFDNIYMFSEVTYPDELNDIGKPNYKADRSQQMLFFEIHTFEGNVRYRSAESENQLFSKYKNIKSARYIKQQEYAMLREHAVHTGNDDLD